MIEHDPDDIERSLGQLVPKPAPSGLRERVLDSALESRRNAPFTLRMRAVAGVCFVLTSLAMIGDAVISKRQSGRIAALLGGPGVSKPAGEEARLLWAELGSDLGDLDKLRREGIALSRLGSRHDSRWAFIEARDRLKGMIDHEDPENFY
jgi:hypothetical protein